MLRAILRAALVLFCLSLSCSAKPAAGLVVSVQTDMPLPKDVSEIRLEVVAAGGLQFGNNYPVGAGYLLVPATLTLLPGAGGPVTIRLFAFQGEKVRMLRESVTTIPTTRVATLRMPIQWLSTGMVTGGTRSSPGSVVTTCPSGKTPEQGGCIDNAVPESELADYDEGSVFGGGNGGGSGECYDLLACFASSITEELRTSDCTVADPGGDKVNVAMVLPASSGDGQCGPKGCLLPLPSGQSGWTRVNGRLALPAAVCARMSAGTLEAVRVSTSCATSTADAPLCGPWSSVSGSSTDAGAGIGSDGDVDSGEPISECTPPTGAGTTHGTANPVNGDETWTAEASPHLIPYDITLSHVITLAPCAEVRIGTATQKTTVSIGTGGKIVGTGTPTKRITITGADAANPWMSIRTVSGAPSGALQLAYATIRGGGDPASSPTFAGMLTSSVQDGFDLQHVTLEGSKSNGISLAGAGSFTSTSKDLVVKDSTGYAVIIVPQNVGTIPPGRYDQGNGPNEILLLNTSYIISSTTMPNRGVPYHVGYNGSSKELRVESGAGVATLTIEAGVTVRFARGGSFLMNGSGATATGALIAKGTSTSPIVFTSAESPPAAGDWGGLQFAGTPDGSDALDFVHVEYAGMVGSAPSDACGMGFVQSAIHIGGRPASGSSFVTNSVISSSAHDGINEGWGNLAAIDFVTPNTFTNVAECHQRNPQTSGCTRCSP